MPHSTSRPVRTLANLGTLYLHSGNASRGKELIARAIAINPDAHFGREKYQLWLAEYIDQSELKLSGNSFDG